MKRAIISDIHSNLEALEAVLRDIESQGITEIYCLGDAVGYGPNPVECIDLVRKKVTMCLLGNHDQASLFDPEGFNNSAERAIFWTREQLENPRLSNSEDRWDFLNNLPRIHREDDFLYVHGSPRNPLNEYVFQDDIYNERRMERLFSAIPKYSFQGHTHVPGIFTEEREFFSPDEINLRYTLGDKKLMINVGSVGQPRDRDPRACYVVLEGNTILYRRVEYPFEKTIEKIMPIPELDNYLGQRLREGK
ncbi:MAG: metallophosphoesterase family protein [Planctomycetaceae bacterium]|jgi:predicted phosphodiesterase|nr:metallophosphoesterase family protein [Planctomycetaceae bacterium]